MAKEDYIIFGILISIVIILGVYTHKEYNIVKGLGLLPKYFGLYVVLISIAGIVCVYLIYLLLEKIGQNQILI